MDKQNNTSPKSSKGAGNNNMNPQRRRQTMILYALIAALALLPSDA